MDDVSRAITLYFGWGMHSFPSPLASRVSDYFGEEKALTLMKSVNEAILRIDELKPDWSTQNLASATKAATDRLARLRPDLHPDAVATLGWAYSWGYK